MNGTPRDRFRMLAQISGREVPLAEGALLIAAEEDPDLDIPRYLSLLDELAASARASVPAGADADAALRATALCQFLSRAGFRGNTESYGDPRNSFLNEVLERRVGIPISLATVFLEVGWRLQLPLYGVGMPAHFLVGCETHSESIFVDPFHTTVLTAEGCGHLFAQLTGGSIPFRKEFLGPTSARDILVRMLRNLKGVYASAPLLKSCGRSELRGGGLALRSRAAASTKCSTVGLANVRSGNPPAPYRHRTSAMLH